MVNARELRRRRMLPTGEPERYDRALAELEEFGLVPAGRGRAGRPGPQAQGLGAQPGAAEVRVSGWLATFRDAGPRAEIAEFAELVPAGSEAAEEVEGSGCTGRCRN